MYYAKLIKEELLGKKREKEGLETGEDRTSKTGSITFFLLLWSKAIINAKNNTGATGLGKASLNWEQRKGSPTYCDLKGGRESPHHCQPGSSLQIHHSSLPPHASKSQVLLTHRLLGGNYVKLLSTSLS